MRYLSTFTGIGGFELGIKQAYENNCPKPKKGNKDNGHLRSSTSKTKRDTVPVCVGYSEIDKYAIQIYQKHFPNHKNYGDITKIDERRLPDFDLLCGGFPCQSFSIAGKRGGFEDTRGTLFFDIARIAKYKRPRLLLLENVKGLLSHDEGRTFNTIILTLDELGYDLQWQVLNSKNHGVPQNRERVFIIGHLRGTCRPEVFPFGAHGQETSQRGVHTGTLTSRYPASQREGTYIEENGYRETKDGFHQFRNDKKKSSIQGTHVTYKTGKSHALNTAHKPMTLVDAKIRRLTPTECERLQGFPDGWTEGVSDTQRYKTLGNAVTVNVIKDIMTKLI